MSRILRTGLTTTATFASALMLSWALPSSAATEAVSRRVRWGGGMGIEGRLSKEVNPDYVETGALPRLYGQAFLWPWGASLELGQQKQVSEAGGLAILARTTELSLWGRYAFTESERWMPYATVGAGVYFDQVTSTLGAAYDERDGERGLFGLGGGLSKRFLKYMNVDVEARAVMAEDRRNPVFSGILRLGVQL
ncbi:MAG: hypothetical protein AB7G93_05070 [Bdellovibrionales bacterium]